MTLIIEDYRRAVAIALKEDLGQLGDITTQALVRPDQKLSMVFVTRQAGVVCGMEFIRQTFRQLDNMVTVELLAADGAAVAAGAQLARVTGAAAPILVGERVALNFLTHLSGIATATRQMVELVKAYQAQISDTRKTTPGLRAFEKQAVAAGGGKNHRMGLYDAVLIKDNHIALFGGDAAAAVQRARTTVGPNMQIEVELDALDQLEQVIAAGANSVLLDNMPPEMLQAAVAQNNGRVVLEASGGVTITNVAAIAATGINIISAGWLTHSAPALDIGLDFVN